MIKFSILLSAAIIFIPLHEFYIIDMKDLSLHIMDILQNSIRAEANCIEVDIIEDTDKDIYRLIFKDNGFGMDEATMTRVVDPFFTTRTVRKVGLGLPLLKLNAEKTGGSLTLDSTVGKGTTVQATFSHKHIDRPVLGDVAGAIVLTASAYPMIHFIYRHNKNGKEFIFDTNLINEALEGVSIQEPEIIASLREMITENLKEIGVEN
jgi:anti-sigma regulatory factor (Ser/Thr protein kinase)